eukprot:681990_1
MATTCRAIDRMTNDKLHQLFNGDMNYLSWEKAYIQRRFHRTNAREPNDTASQRRFESLVRKHNGNKPLLILDVDHTLLYVRFFSEELQINDICTYFTSTSVQKNNSTVIKIRLTLSLIIQNNTIIDIMDKERMDHVIYISTNEELRSYHNNDVFICDMDGMNDVECIVQHIEISGCIIEVHDDRMDAPWMNANQIEIDFTHSNADLNRFEPVLEREGMVPVDFIYEGFLVRVRPNLDELMEYIVDEFDVVLYTAATEDAYRGLLDMLQLYIKQMLGRDTDDDCTLWNDVLYRDDCIPYSDLNGKLHHYKDLTLFGCHLSRCVIVDNSESVCRGLEPNFIFVKDYMGRDDGDDELMELYQYLDVIASVQGDIRYFLCGLEYNDECLDLSTAEKCLNATNKLMDKLKQVHSEELNEMEDESLISLSTASVLKPLRDLTVIRKEKRHLRYKMRAFTTTYLPAILTNNTSVKTRRKSAEAIMNTMGPKLAVYSAELNQSIPYPMSEQKQTKIMLNYSKNIRISKDKREIECTANVWCNVGVNKIIDQTRKTTIAWSIKQATSEDFLYCVFGLGTHGIVRTQRAHLGRFVDGHGYYVNRAAYFNMGKKKDIGTKVAIDDIVEVIFEKGTIKWLVNGVEIHKVSGATVDRLNNIELMPVVSLYGKKLKVLYVGLKEE